MNEPGQMNAATTPKKGGSGKGCFTWGCIIVLVLALIGALAIFLVANKVVNAAMEILDDAPAEFVLPEPTDAEVEAAAKKSDALSQAVDTRSGGRFALSEGELNALIARGLAEGGFGDAKARVRIADGKIGGEISFPADKIIKQLSGKYLNGEATFTLRKTSAADRLQVYVADLIVKGKPVPPEIMKELRSVNLVDEIYVNPNNKDAKAILDSIESIEVDGDRIVFVVVEKAAEPAPE